MSLLVVMTVAYCVSIIDVSSVFVDSDGFKIFIEKTSWYEWIWNEYVDTYLTATTSTLDQMVSFKYNSVPAYHKDLLNIVWYNGTSNADDDVILILKICFPSKAQFYERRTNIFTLHLSLCAGMWLLWSEFYKFSCKIW